MNDNDLKPVLILGGTEEARVLAALLVERGIARPVTSLAGATSRPKPVAGEVRIGPFGGADALAAHIRESGYAAVIDATHPFAVHMSGNVARACETTGVERLVLARQPWTPRDGDRWIAARDEDDAVDRVRSLGLATGATVFLALGAKRIGAFATLSEYRLVLRVVDLAEPPFPNCEILNGRGPFAPEDERRHFRDLDVRVLVCRNSGGSGRAKLEAARDLGIPVVMITRPPPMPGKTVDTVEDAARWVEAITGQAR